MSDHTPPFDEFDLRHALTGQATAIRPVADPARLRQQMVRADRMRTARAAATAGVMAIVVAFGVLNLQSVEERSLETVDRVDTEAPEPTLPGIDDATSETSEVETVTTTTTLAPTTTTVAPLDEQPDHLSAPTTTAPPLLVTTTTVPPTTTAAPTTTTAPPTPAPTTTTTTTSVPPATTTTTVAPEFSAVARYGSCELDPPYDEYSGKAAPGALITITSPHSLLTTTTADGNGDWAVTVFFPTAPANETFVVSLDDGSTTITIDFVHVVA